MNLEIYYQTVSYFFFRPVHLCSLSSYHFYDMNLPNSYCSFSPNQEPYIRLPSFFLVQSIVNFNLQPFPAGLWRLHDTHDDRFIRYIDVLILFITFNSEIAKMTLIITRARFFLLPFWCLQWSICFNKIFKNNMGSRECT